MLPELRSGVRLALFLGALALGGCTARDAGHPAAAEPAPIVVTVSLFGAAPGTDGLVLPARIKAAEEATLAARVSGRLTALPVREGASVRRGDAVARFDAPEMREALAAARSELDAAMLASTLATRQHARVESLFVARVVAPSDRETAESAVRNAAARLARARAEAERLDAAVTLRAPFDAVIVRRHADTGADLAFGSPVIDLRSRGPLEAIVAVPENAVAGLRRGAISVEAPDGAWRPARLSMLDGMIDFATRTRTARLSIGDLSGFEAGAYTRVRLGATKPDPLAGAEAAAAAGGRVALSSITRRGALTGVYVVENAHARLRWIRLGELRGDHVEVLGGLAPGDSVIVSPAALRDGIPVQAGS